jgi:basic membrane protein A
MKRSLLVFVVVGLAVLAMSCGGKQATKAGGTTVRLLTDATGIDDKSFNAAAWRGILSFYGDTWDKPANKGKLYDVVTATTQDMYVPNLKQASDEKYDLIIVTGFTWAEALDEVAPQYPNQKYMIVDVDYCKAPNAMQIVFSEHEGSYLVGVAAALKAQADGIKDPKFGFIGGIPGPVITKFEMGYIQGIKSVLPKAKVLDYYANDWGKPELAEAGTFKGEVVVLDTKADGVGFSDKNPELGADIVAKVNEARAKIVDGTIKVIPTYAEAKAAGVVPSNLQASDK